MIPQPARIARFQARYGDAGASFRLLVEEFLQRAPEFPGDLALARRISEALADLEYALDGGAAYREERVRAGEACLKNTREARERAAGGAA